MKHPVTVGNEADFLRIKGLIGKDDFVTGLYERIIKKANELTGFKPHMVYLDDINYNVEENRSRLDFLSFAYYITKEKRYLDAAIRELELVCNLPDWQGFKFLNTAGLGIAVAVAYDRLFDDLTEEKRKKYRDALITKLIKPALSAYDAKKGELTSYIAGIGREKKSYEGYAEWFASEGWCLCESNWSAVCNGAVITAACAIYDSEPEIAKDAIQKAVKSIKVFLEVFEPYGAFEEGISYWFYANLYLSQAIASLNNTFGEDGGLVSGKGFIKCLEYAEAMNHGAYNFNFHDVGVECRIDTSPLMYYAGRLKLPHLGRSRVKAFKDGYLPIGDSMNVTDLLWYDEEYSKEGDTGDSDDVYFPITETCVLRDGDIAVALHGGDNAANHGHIDNGSVILDALGKRWFCDLGKDMASYSPKCEMEYSRWDIYRMRAEGHNCIVINPDSEPGQCLDAVAVITEFSKGKVSRAKIDLTSSYTEAESLTRELILDKERRTLEICDDILLKEDSAVYSFWHTRAAVELSDDKAILKSGEESIEISCNYPIGVIDAKPFDCSPVVPEQAVNEGVSKLCIRIDNVKKAKIKIKINLEVQKNENFNQKGNC